MSKVALVKSITRKKHPQGVKVYCFHEPFRNECLVIGNSGRAYASFQSTNFAFLFGQSANTYAQRLSQEWTEAYRDEFILNYGILNPKNEDPWKIVAEFIRNRFFNAYPKLSEWIERNKNLGIQHGFIDDIHFGYRRHLPFLYLGGRQMGANENTKRFFNLLNITTNSLAQSSESLHVYSSLARIHKELNRLKMRSRPFAVIHDYIGFYCHRSAIE
jgi:hypothetical protein